MYNGRGFEILADTSEKFEKFLEEYKNTENSSQSEFFRKWLKFDTYRKVVIK